MFYICSSWRRLSLNTVNSPTFFDKMFWMMLKITGFWILISMKEGRKDQKEGGRKVCRCHLSFMCAGILCVDVASVLFRSQNEMLLFYFCKFLVLACHSDLGQSVEGLHASCLYAVLLTQQNWSRGYPSPKSILPFFFNSRTPSCCLVGWLVLTWVHSFKATCESRLWLIWHKLKCNMALLGSALQRKSIVFFMSSSVLLPEYGCDGWRWGCHLRA